VIFENSIDLAFFENFWLQIKHLYFVPGDVLISCFIHTDIGRFYEFTDADLGGVFSFFVPWFLMAILMASIDDTKEGKIELFTIGKKVLTKEGKRKFKIFYILLFSLVLIYISLWFFYINYLWLSALLGVIFLLSNAYVFLTNGYSVKQKKFKKPKKTLTKQGVRVAIEILVIFFSFLALYIAYRLFNVDCSIVLPITIIVAVLVYFSIGNRWKRLKQEVVKTYKKIKSYLRGFKS
jgi:hypothetical protein